MPRNDSTRNKQLLILILAAAVLIRIPVALYMGDQVTVLPGIQDQVSYDALAHSLLDGRGYSFTKNWYPFTPPNTPTAHWSFVYPPYLAGIYAVTGYHPLAARLLQAAAGGALMCLLIYLIGRRVADEATGLVAAALAAVYGYFVYYSAALMTETFSILLVLVSLYSALELREESTFVRWAGLGFSLGLAALLRQTALLFVPFLLLWLWWERKAAGSRRWHFAVPLLAIALTIAPWSIRNYLAYRHFLLLNSNAGYAFYASNNPSMGTRWNNDLVVVPVPDELAGKNEAELDSALTRKALGLIVTDPKRILLLDLNKTLEYFRFWPSSDSGTISNVNRVLSFGLYLPFMLAGLYLTLSRWRNFLLLYLFIVVHTGVHLLTWPSPRYRLPVDALLMVFAGFAVVELARQLRTRRHGLSPA